VISPIASRILLENPILKITGEKCKLPRIPTRNNKPKSDNNLLFSLGALQNLRKPKNLKQLAVRASKNNISQNKLDFSPMTAKIKNSKIDHQDSSKLWDVDFDQRDSSQDSMPKISITNMNTSVLSSTSNTSL
jgi:hypothetical protein